MLRLKINRGDQVIVTSKSGDRMVIDFADVRSNPSAVIINLDADRSAFQIVREEVIRNRSTHKPSSKGGKSC